MANNKDNATTDDQGTRNRGFTSSSTVGTSKKDASSPDAVPETGSGAGRVQTTDEIINQTRFTAEELRQQQQRDETQAFLDEQEAGRQMMAAQTKAREESAKKAEQRNQKMRQQQQAQQQRDQKK
jgi:hypothetical protein